MIYRVQPNEYHLYDGSGRGYACFKDGRLISLFYDDGHITYNPKKSEKDWVRVREEKRKLEEDWRKEFEGKGNICACIMGGYEIIFGG